MQLTNMHENKEKRIPPVMQDFQPERPQVQPEAEDDAADQYKLPSENNALALCTARLGLVHNLQ